MKIKRAIQLVDLSPTWILNADRDSLIGVRFLDPDVQGVAIDVYFANPIGDGAYSAQVAVKHLRIGTEFESMSLHPAIDGESSRWALEGGLLMEI